MANESDMAALHREYLHIVNKDGAFNDWEKRRVDTLQQIFGAEPDLKNLLIDLDIRQRSEETALTDQLVRQRRNGTSADIIASQNQHGEMEKRHDQERERYVSEYQQAKDILREMNEKTQTLDRNQDRKLSR